jgi:hypothetical protein
MSAFTIGQGFFLGATIYIVVPSLMLFLSLVLPVRATRMANIVVAACTPSRSRGRDRRVELLHPRKPHRGRSAGMRRLLRVDLTEGYRRGYHPVGPVPHRHRRARRDDGARVASEPRFGASTLQAPHEEATPTSVDPRTLTGQIRDLVVCRQATKTWARRRCGGLVVQPSSRAGPRTRTLGGFGLWRPGHAQDDAQGMAA